MMYQQKFVAVLKVNGKVLSEHGEGNEDVYMPFGSEYSIPLKNLSNQKALVRIYIDGREITGGGLILLPHQEVELERFIDNDDLSKGYKLKFIKKTKEIQEHRGDKLEDGLIRVEWQFEKDQPFWTYWNAPVLRSFNDNWQSRKIGSSASPGSLTYSSTGGAIGGSTVNLCSCNISDQGHADVFACAAAPFSKPEMEVDDTPLDDEGITVEGSDSNQRFIQGYIGELEHQVHQIIFRLRGHDPGKKPVNKPVYVDTRIQCKQCGKKWKSSHQFCGGCGARLIG